MNIRDQFPILKKKAYFASCSHGALSVAVRQAYENYLQHRDTYGAYWEFWVNQLEIVRAGLAKLLHCGEDEIAVTASVTAALNSLVSALNFSQQRNKIVCTDFDFPTTAQIWHEQQSRGTKILQVQASADGMKIPFSRFQEAIDQSTAVVSIPHVCYRNGAKLDIAPIVKLAHSKGALVFLDAYQAVGACGIDVKDLGVDALFGGMQKYLLGSSGVGFMYVARALVEKLRPSSTGWFCQENINAMDIYANQPSLSARRFEGGTPNVPNLYAAIAGLDLIHTIGIDKIERHIALLTSAIKEDALQRGFTLATPIDADEHGALIAIKSNNMYELVRKLAQGDVVVSCRDGNIRISPHIYNNIDDVNKLFAVLDENIELLVR